MIAIVRMKAQESRQKLWDYIVTHVEELQERLRTDGRLLYLSQRAKHEDVSLFVHVNDPDTLGTLIAEELSKADGLTGCWIINMLRPVFFPILKDTRGLKRCAITLGVFPPRLNRVYESLLKPDLLPGIMIAYVALTCHLYGDCVACSALAQDEESLNSYVNQKLKALPGVLRTTVNFIEKTKPLISYEEWKDYSARHSLVPSWDERFMIHQFGR